MSNTVRLRVGFAPFFLGGMLENTDWAVAADWADTIGACVKRLVQTARSAKIRAIEECTGMHALTKFIGEPKLMQWRVWCNRYNHDALVQMMIMLVVMLMRVLKVTTVAMAGLVIMMLTFMVLTCCLYGDENTDGDNSGNSGAGATCKIMMLTFMVLTCWSLW
jgi:hypothetical protein